MTSHSILFALGPEALVFLACAVFVAAFVRGFAGFGFSALVVTATGLVSNPLFAVPVVMICEIAMTIGQARTAADKVNWQRAGLMLAGAALVIPFSVWILAQLGMNGARLVISGFVLIICFLLWRGWQLKHQIGHIGHFFSGIISGLANGAAVGGLPIALLMSAQNIPPAVFRATMIFYLSAIDLVALPFLWWNGLLNQDSIIAFGCAIPLIILGGVFGGRYFHASSPTSFRRFAIILLAVLAVLGGTKSLLAL